MTSTAIVTQETVPAYLANLSVGAADNFDNSDATIPKVKLLQSTSGECSTFDTAKSGHFWHTGADQSFGDSFRFVIASRRKKYLLIAPIEDGQGVLARSEDGKTWDRTGSWQVKIDKKTTVAWEIKDLDVLKSGLTNWGTSDPSDPNSSPAATLVYEYLVLMPDFPDLGPAVVSLARSAIRKAKKGLNDKIQLQRGNGRPLQSLLFNAKAVADSSDSGPYNNWSFTSAGFADQELYQRAVNLSELLSEYVVKDEDMAAPAPVKVAHSDDY